MIIFRDIARAGSIAAAARQLGWTQPAVSQHLRSLEHQVRCTLVIRESRGVRLTEAGQALLIHADAVAARVHSAEEELAALAQLRAGTVRLAAFPSASATLVPAALAALTTQHPGLDVQLHETEPPDALEQVRAGEVDLALVFAYSEAEPLDSAELVTRPIKDDPIKVVLPSDHALSRRRRLNLSSLSEERWVAGCTRCSAHLHAVCAQSGFSPDVRHHTDDYVVAQALVAQKLAVTLLPQLALDSYRHPDVAVVHASGTGSRHLMLVHHREAPRVPATAATIRAITSGARVPAA